MIVDEGEIRACPVAVEASSGIVFRIDIAVITDIVHAGGIVSYIPLLSHDTENTVPQSRIDFLSDYVII